MTKSLVRWIPTSLLAFGALFTVGIDPQRRLPLRQPLSSAIPRDIVGYRGEARQMSAAELRVVGVSNYLLRDYEPIAPLGGAGFNLYIGYYERQLRGTTIHSPKNCLPGAGWEPLAAESERIVTMAGPVDVNRFLLQHGSERDVVLYWYQGRGRVASDEYLVKWELLRDAALRHRSDEALVRIVVPVTATPESALELSAKVAQELIPSLYAALPR